MKDEVHINPDTGRPYREFAYRLAISPRVLEHLERYEVTWMFGRFLAERSDEAESTYPVNRDTAVRIVYRDGGGYSMMLADERPSQLAYAVSELLGFAHAAVGWVETNDREQIRRALERVRAALEIALEQLPEERRRGPDVEPPFIEPPFGAEELDELNELGEELRRNPDAGPPF